MLLVVRKEDEEIAFVDTWTSFGKHNYRGANRSRLFSFTQSLLVQSDIFNKFLLGGMKISCILPPLCQTVVHQKSDDVY